MGPTSRLEILTPNPSSKAITDEDKILSLLSAGADLNHPALLRVPSRVAKSRMGTPICRYPIEFAAASSTLEIFKLLLDRGAKLQGTYCLHAAAGGQGRSPDERIKIMRFLIEEKGVDVNKIEFADEKELPKEYAGRIYGTPLHYAAAWGFADRVEYLLEKGADPTLTGLNYETGDRWWTALEWQKINEEDDGCYSTRVLELLGDKKE